MREDLSSQRRRMRINDQSLGDFPPGWLSRGTTALDDKLRCIVVMRQGYWS